MKQFYQKSKAINTTKERYYQFFSHLVFQKLDLTEQNKHDFVVAQLHGLTFDTHICKLCKKYVSKLFALAHIAGNTNSK